MKLGEVISGYRQNKKQSLEALAAEIGIDHTALWRLETGKGKSFQQWPKVLLWLFNPNNFTIQTDYRKPRRLAKDIADTTPTQK